MHLIDDDTFLIEAAKQGIGLDTRYAEPRDLGYQNDFRLSVPLTDDVRQRRIVFALTFDLFADESPVAIWKCAGTWGSERRDPAALAMRAVLSLAGVKDGMAGTLYSDGGEKGLLFTLIYMNSLLAVSRWDDLFVVPDGYGLVIYFSHHEEIILECRDQQVYDAIGMKYFTELRRLGIPVDDEQIASSDNVPKSGEE